MINQCYTRILIMVLLAFIGFGQLACADQSTSNKENKMG